MNVVRIIGILLGISIVAASCGGAGEPDEAAVSTKATATSMKPPQTAIQATANPSTEFSPSSYEDLVPSFNMFDADYVLQSSNYMFHDRIEALPGFVEGVVTSYNLDIETVSNPENFMLSFGALCVEFDSAENAEAGFDELVAILEDTPSADPEEADIDPLPVRYQAFRASVPFENEQDENADHIMIQAGRFACQYTGIALRGYHEPLEDVRRIVEQIVTQE